MTKLRKFFASSVMVMTVVVMSGLTAPMTTNAAASAGDLIKKDGLSAVYYLGQDGKRYVFPNEATYKSWYSDFSGVVTISSDELASYPLGGNVVVRPGTKLVKITTDPRVYAVEANGTLRQIPSEAAAIALYGSDWAKRVIDVADSFFTNYTIGSALASNEVPMGSLVKKTGETSIYYYDGTNYRLIEDEVAFLANRFQYANVLTLSSFTAGGSTITGAEAGIIKTSQTGSTGTVVTGSGLTVALNSMTPASASVPSNGSRVPMAKVNLTAANDGAITVSSITVKRIGLSTYSNIGQVWAEKDGTIVASKKSMNSNDESILTFSPALTVNAGQTATLDLIASLAGSGAGNIGLSIVSASAVSASAATVSGSFPINGNLMSPTSYVVTDVAISGAVTATSSVKVGDEKIEMGRFQLEVTRDVVVNSITLRNNGVEDLAKASMNLYLEQAGTKVSTGYSVNGRYVTFQLGNFNILKDDVSKLFYVKGDVIAKENTASNSFSFVLHKSTDLVAYEKATGFGANVVTGTPAATADGYAVSNLTITAGAISVSKKSTSPSDTTIVKGTDNTILLANVRVDEAVTVEGLNLTYATTTATQFENARVYVNGVLLDSFDPATTTNSRAIDSTFTLNKGDNEVKIMVRAKSNATANSAINFTLTGSSMFTLMNPEYVISGNSVTVTPGGSATSATFTVQGGKLTTTRNDGYATIRTIVKGSSDVSLGKFIVKAENDEVKITSIALGANIGSSTGTTSSDNISDMKLYVDGIQVGNTINFSSTGATFSSLNVVVSKDTTKNIEIKGSFDSSASGVFQVDMTSTAQDSRGTAITTSNGSVLTARTTSFSIADQGTLNVALGGNTPSAGLMASKNGVEQEIAQFRFTAINDDANLTELNIINVASSTQTSIASTTAGVDTSDARIAAIKLYDGSTLIDSFVPVNGAGKFTITNDRVKVLANSNKTLSIKVVLNNIENDADATNKDITLGITTLKFKSSNGTENTQGVALLANNFRVRKSIPTVATVALPTTVLTAGDAVISKFTVTADANGDVALKKIVLTTTNTSNATITTSSVASTLKVNGSFKTVASVAYSDNKITVTLANDEIVSAGSSKTFEIMAGLTVSGTGSESVTTKIVEDTSYATTGSFEWSDGASILAGTYSNGHRVNGLTTMTQVLSK